MNEFDFKTVMLLLSAALAMSLVIERILEAVKWLMKKMILSENSPFAEKAQPVETVLSELGFKKINDKLDDLVEELEETRIEMKKAEGDELKQLKIKEDKLEEQAVDLVSKYAALFKSQSRNSRKQETEMLARQEVLNKRIKNGKLDTTGAEVDEKFSLATVIVDPIAGRNPEKTARVFWLQILGTLAGVLICHFSEFGIFSYLTDLQTPQTDWILTGILIGGGSQPVHTLIKFVQSRQTTDLIVNNRPTVESEEQKRREESGAPAIVTPPAPSKFVFDVEYHGGVDRDKLEHAHKRLRDPEFIVYHHTAMHSDTTFADVVQVIKNKNWSTGYNCVILQDGSIHPYCRWDRYGNHVKGYNRRSLGIAFNGNFEPNPKIPYSNANGRLGIIRPTDEQLLAAGKVVALWCHLYDIPVEYEKSIIPHKDLAAKACPGSNFPYSKFKSLVDKIYESWKSQQVRDELTLFKQKQYLYV